MRPLVVETELEVSEAVDRGLSKDGADDGASLIIRRHVFVSRPLRDEVQKLQVECPELVGHDCFVTVLQRLK